MKIDRHDNILCLTLVFHCTPKVHHDHTMPPQASSRLRHIRAAAEQGLCFAVVCPLVVMIFRRLDPTSDRAVTVEVLPDGSKLALYFLATMLSRSAAELY